MLGRGRDEIVQRDGSALYETQTRHVDIISFLFKFCEFGMVPPLESLAPAQVSIPKGRGAFPEAPPHRNLTSQSPMASFIVLSHLYLCVYDRLMNICVTWVQHGRAETLSVMFPMVSPVAAHCKVSIDVC